MASDRKTYIDERELSRITGRALPTIRNDRHKGQGFPYRKFGRQVRYCLEEIIETMESRKVETNPI